jgi:hypothetical protein
MNQNKENKGLRVLGGTIRLIVAYNGHSTRLITFLKIKN